ncbi:5,10-methenyltetrahydrofolate synthetase [Paracoccus thiocyanatus]|uniref:5,10-methenyltetrahydrofolate synthetase n=2 Tax=Paracoccus TaxID=265 RepID=A0A1N7A6Z5_9RHOB|nr:5,10-methenyltetrahydrofolate synthetase [Paracoccus thiocyanatus]
MADLYDAGLIFALLVVEVRDSPLVFRRWPPELRMVRGDWDIPVPPADTGRLTPDVSVSPVVGWDRVGFRLGYSGGYFDRTLVKLAPRPFPIGIGLQAAQLANIFPEPHYIPLNVVLTETGVQFPGEGR